jgi:predicted amidophosphoribosyltransferase
MQCSRCGKKLGGLRESGIFLKLENEEVTVCYDCFGQIKNLYASRRICNGCAFFNEGYCKKIQTELAPIWIGTDAFSSKDYYVQGEQCTYYITKEEYETKAIRGEIGTEGKNPFVFCGYCHTRYNWNDNAKCPTCGAPNNQVNP